MSNLDAPSGCLGGGSIYFSNLLPSQRCCIGELYGEPLVLVSALLGQCHCSSAALGGQLWALTFSKGVNLTFVTTGMFRRTR